MSYVNLQMSKMENCRKYLLYNIFLEKNSINKENYRFFLNNPGVKAKKTAPTGRFLINERLTACLDSEFEP